MIISNFYQSFDEYGRVTGFFAMVLLCCSAVIYPMGFDSELIGGPNSVLGRNSVLIMIESQFDYIINCLKYMEKNQHEVLVVKANVCNQYNKDILKKLKHTVWQEGGCRFWYQDKLGNNTILWPGFTWTYCLLVNHFDYQNYQFEKGDDHNRNIEYRSASGANEQRVFLLINPATENADSLDTDDGCIHEYRFTNLAKSGNNSSCRFQND
ncbi:unnamed protein product [Didymodactylos carnosus]|uniref:Uncharacterized protein n=1 Tax=Didymodactylos carnosus TaxID=1234261 RepID=A0A8S2DA48_9BILA|nr:unnamed protein product [Didymodactylos carnosus]CAF3696542.1 unnamed protein product [Didymodactylos carnosus]